MLNTFQQADHAMLPKSDLDQRHRQEFAKSFKSFIQGELLPGLTPTYKHRAARAFEKAEGRAPASRHDIRKVMWKDPYFRHYAAANRISQEFIWDAVLDPIDRDLDTINAEAKRLSESSPAELEIDPDFKTPRYVTAFDIHCMPGGYAGEVTKDDVSIGALYDRGVYLYAMGYMGPNNDDMGRSVTNYIKRNLKGFEPRAILDMGCTVGHSTLPFKEAFPDAEVTGIDVGAPVVRYAHARAAAMGTPVHFRQRDASATGFPDESFDLVVSHILLHETSGKAMPAIFKECHRILKPGGYMIHADLPPFDNMDPFMQFILDNETYFNNEPFWGAMREMDQVQLARDAGFPADTIRFDTAPMAMLEFAGAAPPETAEREFVAGEYAPGGGWEVLIARKAG